MGPTVGSSTRSDFKLTHYPLELLIATGEEKCRINDGGVLRETLRGYGFAEVTDYMLDRVGEHAYT